MIWWVSLVSLVISFSSFLLFGVTLLFPRTPRSGTVAEARTANVEGWAKLAEAIAKVIDSLSKAGPSVLTLTSAIVFMVISFLAAKA